VTTDYCDVTSPYVLGMLVRLDTISVKFEGQDHGSKFAITGGNVAKVVGATSSWAF